MEIIIGREEGGHRLHCIINGKEFNIGQEGSVPMSVSRKHCKITINGDAMSIENLKPQNITFVDNVQIFSKAISTTSNVQLGEERYQLPLQQIIKLAGGPTFSLKPLEAVWEEYENRKLEIQEKAAKDANMNRLMGIIPMIFVIAASFIPNNDSTTLKIVNQIIGIIRMIGVIIFIYFMVRSFSKDILQKQLSDLDKEYADKYKCPNPECGKPFGGIPYRQIKYNKQCFACGCKYTH